MTMQATTAQMLIDGEATEAASGEWIDVDNPADEAPSWVGYARWRC